MPFSFDMQEKSKSEMEWPVSHTQHLHSDKAINLRDSCLLMNDPLGKQGFCDFY